MGFLILTALGNLAMVQAQKADPQALLLYNFGKFAGFDHGGDQFTFAILGNAGLAINLKQISKNKKIKGKPVQVKTCKSLDQIGTPEILFVPACKSGLMPQILDQTRGKPVKILTEIPGGILGDPNLKDGPGTTIL